MRIALTAALVLAATPALAFDCTRATSAVDLAICGDDAALAANGRMEAAYGALRSGLAADGRAMLLAGQREWLVYRDRRCGAVAACLAEESDNRTASLASTPAGMAPFFLFQPGVANGYEVMFAGYRFPTPDGAAEMAYEAWFDWLIDNSAYGGMPDTEDEHPPYADEGNITIERLTPALISAVAWRYSYTGGAHPNSETEGFLVDRRSGRPPSATDLFGVDGLAKLVDDCARQIVRADNVSIGDDELDEGLKLLEESYPGVVAETVAAPERWHVGDDGLHVRFDSYAVAPYSAGPQECLFPMDRLAALGRDLSLFTAR